MDHQAPLQVQARAKSEALFERSTLNSSSRRPPSAPFSRAEQIRRDMEE
jgi:hypothetical protein